MTAPTSLTLPREQWSIVNHLATNGRETAQAYPLRDLLELVSCGLVEGLRSDETPVSSTAEFRHRHGTGSMTVHLTAGGDHWAKHNPGNVALATVAALAKASAKVRMDEAVQVSGQDVDVFVGLVGRGHIAVKGAVTGERITADELKTVTARYTPDVAARLVVSLTHSGRHVLGERT